MSIAFILCLTFYPIVLPWREIRKAIWFYVGTLPEHNKNLISSSNYSPQQSVYMHFLGRGYCQISIWSGDVKQE